MNDRHDIDARMDAALAAQVRAPRLDRGFDAAVWRRIEAEKRQSARATSPAPAPGVGAARWLRACNLAGVVVTGVLLAYFGLQVVDGTAATMWSGTALALPESWLAVAPWVITACALAFGLRFTALGKRLRAELF